MCIGRRNTTALAYDASAAEVEAALEALPTIDDVDVRRAGPSAYGEYEWAVTFRGGRHRGDLPLLGVNGAALELLFGLQRKLYTSSEWCK